jgi:hypothetical protein
MALRLISICWIVQITILLVGANKPVNAAPSEDLAVPQFEIWYGLRQPFGKPGIPQKWFNLLGSLRESKSNIVSLVYSLNGKPGRIYDSVPGKLKVGPVPTINQPRRLMNRNDFNIDIHKDELIKGENIIRISALNEAGMEFNQTVAVDYHSENVWPLPYRIDWSSVRDVKNVLLIVDGLWSWNNDGIRTKEIGYDRTLAIGDMSWQYYEVLVAVTVHGIADPVQFPGAALDGIGFGIHLRWHGHSDVPIANEQPKCGWDPHGASAWYVFRHSEGNRKLPENIFLLTVPVSTGSRGNASESKIQFDKDYWFKARVEPGNQGDLYKMKVWEKAGAEPENWLLQKAPKGNLETGSLLIVAHYVDITIGNVAIQPVQINPK